MDIASSTAQVASTISSMNTGNSTNIGLILLSWLGLALLGFAIVRVRRYIIGRRHF